MKGNMPQVKQAQKEELQKYRYYCIACTGVAFICEGKNPKNHASVCSNCGFTVHIEEQNFLPLEDGHEASLLHLYK